MKKEFECSVCYEDCEVNEEGLILWHRDDRHGKGCTGVGDRPAGSYRARAVQILEE
ncbi:MAG TPA: hypothetical protein PKD79_01040 [Candidatus Doudnabacteria bacterium]|nr:hypothetical protein [Candidatus Doudnabacteria bacterium]